MSTVRGERGGSSIFSFPVVSESIFNSILSDFWHQGLDWNVFDSNGFLVQLNPFFLSVPAIRIHFCPVLRLVKSP